MVNYFNPVLRIRIWSDSDFFGRFRIRPCINRRSGSILKRSGSILKRSGSTYNTALNRYYYEAGTLYFHTIVGHTEKSRRLTADCKSAVAGLESS